MPLHAIRGGFHSFAVAQRGGVQPARATPNTLPFVEQIEGSSTIRSTFRAPTRIAKSKVVGEIVDEDPDRCSQSSAGREYKMKGDFLRAPTGEYPNHAS